MTLVFNSDTNYNVGVGAVSLGSGSTSPDGVIVAIDSILRGMNLSFLPIGSVRCLRLFGYNQRNAIYTTEVDRGFRISPRYDASADLARYGSVFTALREVSRGLTSYFSPLNEHNIIHYQSVGSAVPYDVSSKLTRLGMVDIPPHLPRYSDTYGIRGYGYSFSSKDSIRSWPGTLTNRGFSLAGSTDTWTQSGKLLTIHNGKLFGVLSPGDNYHWTDFESVGGGTKDVYIRDLSFSLSSWKLSGSYIVGLLESYTGPVTHNGVVYNGPHCFEYRVNFDIWLDYVFQDNSRIPPIPPGEETLHALTLMTNFESWKYTCVKATGICTGGWYQGIPITVGKVVSWQHTRQVRFTTDTYVGLTTSPSLGTRPVTIFSPGRAIIEENFRSWFERSLPDMRAATFLSSADAMTNLASSPRKDVLQTLVKLNNITSQLPQIGEAVSLVRRIANRDLSSITDILNFLSHLRLQQAFQWRPEFDLLVSYLPKIPELMLSFDHTDSNRLVGRGEMSHNFAIGPDVLRACSMTVRTKIVVSDDISPPLAAYLKADGLGILPSPANLWDIVPYSFVVNWFTNMGERIRTLGEASNLWLLNPIVIVHSFKLTSAFTEDELNAMSIRAAPGTEPLYMKIYHREVSRFVSSPFTSKFDFQAPTTTPDWSVVASLLWQWMT